jgi:hypothetical protein
VDEDLANDYYVEHAEFGWEIIGIAIVNPAGGSKLPMHQPIGFFYPAQISVRHGGPGGVVPLHETLAKRQTIPARRRIGIHGHNRRAAALCLERQESAGRTDVKNGLAPRVDISNILIETAAQIPMGPLQLQMTGDPARGRTRIPQVHGRP